MFRSFRAISTSLLFASAFGCRGSSSGTPVTPSIGTVATAQGTVMLAGTYNPLSGVVVSIDGARLITGRDGSYAVSGLTPGDAVLTAERQGYQRFSERVVLEGARTFNIFLSPSALSPYGGAWRGTWSTGARSGGLVMSIVVDTVTQAMRVALDIGGNIVGDFDPPGENYLGTAAADAVVHFVQVSPVFGNISADLVPGGQFSGHVTQVPIGGVSRFTFSGTMTPLTVNVSYVIMFNDNTTQNGTATLTR